MFCCEEVNNNNIMSLNTLPFYLLTYYNVFITHLNINGVFLYIKGFIRY